MALLGKGLERACRAVHGGVGYGEDGDQDYCVHDGVETLNSSGFDGDDKGGGFGGDVIGVDKFGFCVGYQEAYDRDGDHVENGYAPKYLLDGRGESFAGVMRLSCSQAHELGAGE